MDDTQDGQSTFGTTADAVAELDRREAARTKQSSQPEGDGEVDESRDAGDDENGEIDDVADEEDGDEIESEDGDEDEDGETSVIKFAGQEYEVPEGTPVELAKKVEKLGKNLEADYTRKTQEVAHVRALVTKAAQESLAQADYMGQQAQIAMNFLGDMIGEEPDAALIHSDPQEFLMRKELRAQRLEQYGAMQKYLAQINEQKSFAERQQQDIILQQEFPKLAQALPEVKTEKGYRALQKRAFEVGAKYGFSQQEIATNPDSRVVLALNDLAEFQRLKVAKGSLREQQKNIPPRVLKPVGNAPQNGKRQKVKEATREFMKSPRTDRDLRKWAERTS
jgi:hypothetical protein